MFRKQRLGEYISFMFRSANSFDIISNWNTSVGSGSFNGACAIKEASPGKPSFGAWQNIIPTTRLSSIYELIILR